MAWTSEGLHEQARKRLQETTGKSFFEWREVAVQSQLTDSIRLQKYLEKKGLGPQQATMVAYDIFVDNKYHLHENTPQLVLNSMFPEEAGLGTSRELAKKIIRIGLSFGIDVRVAYTREKISLKRYRSFAEITPGKAGEVVLRLKLHLKKGTSSRRKRNTGSGMTMRVVLRNQADLTDELTGWMQKAFRDDMDAYPYHLEEQHRIL